MLLPEGVTHLDMDAGIDPGVAIAQGCGGDVDGIYADVNRPLGPGEVVEPDAALGREVPDTCASGLAMGNKNVRRKLVGGIDEPAGTLEPGLKTLGPGKKIPAKNNRRKACASVRAAAERQFTGLGTAIQLLVRRRGIGLPKGHDVGADFELSAQDSGIEHRGDRLGQL